MKKAGGVVRSIAQLNKTTAPRPPIKVSRPAPAASWQSKICGTCHRCNRTAGALAWIGPAGVVTVDGLLRKVSQNTWRGTLNGYVVTLSGAGRHWLAHIATPKPREYTRVILNGKSLGHAAALARWWIESTGPMR